MSYAERDFATVPAAAPAWKNQRTTSCPAPISAKVPYFASSRLILRAFRFVVNSSVDSIGFSGKARIPLYQERNYQLSSRNNSETGTPVQKNSEKQALAYFSRCRRNAILTGTRARLGLLNRIGHSHQRSCIGIRSGSLCSNCK